MSLELLPGSVLADGSSLLCNMLLLPFPFNFLYLHIVLYWLIICFKTSCLLVELWWLCFVLGDQNGLYLSNSSWWQNRTVISSYSSSTDVPTTPENLRSHLLSIRMCVSPPFSIRLSGMCISWTIWYVYNRQRAGSQNIFSQLLSPRSYIDQWELLRWTSFKIVHESWSKHNY